MDKETKTHTLRDLLKRIAEADNLDAEVKVTFFNGEPQSVASVEFDDEDGCTLILSGK